MGQLAGAATLLWLAHLQWQVADAATSCLPEALSPNSLQNVTVDGVSMPIGVFVGDWTSAWLVSEAWRIIVKERFGYNVALRSSQAIEEGFYALASCKEPWDVATGLTCGQPAGAHHFSLEVWDSYSALALPLIANSNPEAVPVRLGLIGYVGQEGMYVLGDALDSAKNQRGLPLEYYASYNASWNDLSAYFAKGSDFDPATLMDCSDIKTYNSSMLLHYPNITGDEAGVVRLPNGLVSQRCDEGKWWFSPACRTHPDRCIPLITGGNGWSFQRFVQLATFNNLPIRIATAASWGSYTKASSIGKSPLLYWWFPDTTFLLQNPTLVTFPPTNPTEYSNGVYKTTMPSDPINKWVAPQIRSVVPELVEFTTRMSISQDMIGNLLRAYVPQSATSSSDPAWDTACAWLKANREIWQVWIPGNTQCTSGNGLVNVQGQFVENLTSATSCARCEPGRFSQPLGTSSAICAPCSSGRFSDAFAASQCSKCPRGTFAATLLTGTFSSQAGMTACSPCPKGHFQPEKGNTSCESCQVVLPGSTTLGKGTISSADCTCPQGWYYMKPSNSTSFCRPCDLGLECPGGNGNPVQAASFFARRAEFDLNQALVSPPQMVRCAEGGQCPNGLPLGSCPPRAHGLGCSSCEPFLHWNGQGCVPCSSASGTPLAVAITIFVLIAGAISVFLAGGDSALRHDRASLAVTFGLNIHMVQTILAFRDTPLLWVEPLTTIRNVAAAVGNFFSPNCVFGVNSGPLQYMIIVLVLPIFLVLVLIGLGVQRRLGRARINRFSAFNATGTLVVVFNLGLLMIAVFPFQCTLNPDGTSSVTGMRGVTCWTTSEHATMIGLAVGAVIAFIVLPISVIIWATIIYPTMQVRRGGITFLRRFDFVFSLFVPERYYYGIVYMVRNLLLAILPVALQQVPSLNGVCMTCVLIIMAVLQTMHFPWRTTPSNYLYTGQLVGLVMVLVACQVASPTTSDTAKGFATFVGAIFVCGLLGVLSLLAYLLIRTCQSDKKYQIFISHHKGSASVLARWLKMELSDRVKGDIFLDADDLSRLDNLSEIVAQQTRNLVVLLTQETLSRLWCAGEITLAIQHKVNIIPVACEDYEGISDDFLASIDGPDHKGAERWATNADNTTMSTLGVSRTQIRNAYEEFRKIPTIPLSRMDDLSQQTSTVLTIIQKCHGIYRHARFIGEEMNTTQQTGPFVGLVADSREPEANALRVVVQRRLQQFMKVDVKSIYLNEKPKDAVCVVVILTKNALTDPTLAALLATQLPDFPWVPLIADTNFVVPEAQFFRDITSGNVFDRKDLPCSLERVSGAYKHLFKALALRVSPQASEQLLRTELEQMAKRLERYFKLNLRSTDIVGTKSPTSLGWESFSTPSSEGQSGEESGDPVPLGHVPTSMPSSREGNRPSPLRRLQTGEEPSSPLPEAFANAESSAPVPVALAEVAGLSTQDFDEALRREETLQL